jgi:hypothetical protein
VVRATTALNILGNTMRVLNVLLIVSAAAIAITGCNQQPGVKSDVSINQANVCEAGDSRRDVVASACKPGQKVVFLPQAWGNEQLPVLFAAINCDLRFSVVLTKGAVTCIYSPTTSP